MNTRKRRNGNIVTCSADTKVLLDCIVSAGTNSQLQGIMGNWDILLFLLQSSLYLSAFLTLLSLPFSLCLPSLSSPIPSYYSSCSPLNPSIPILIISNFNFHSVFLSSLHLSLSPPHPHRHPSLPILIALPTGGHSQAGLLVLSAPVLL